YLGWQPGGMTAHGQLLSPARPIPEEKLLGLDGQTLANDPLRGMWTLLYVGDADCNQACEQSLYNMRQVWKSLGRKRKRVQGSYLLTEAPTAEWRTFFEREHQGMTVARPAQDAQPWLDFFSLDGEIQPLQTDNIYVVDPLGNWVLVFRPGDEPKGLLKDLKKLLRLSNIG
ncbi:MAG: SCO family protein, partial [Nevskiales bacterium]